jgi:HlyD family secretion protein
MKIDKAKLIIAIPVIIVILGIIILAKNAATPNEMVITGIVECKTVDVASKIPGRVDRILFKEGDHLKKGDTIAILESKEMSAKVEQARSLMEAARAKLALVKKGARDEEKQAALKMYDQARYQYEYVSKTWARFQKLYSENIISAQEKDGVEFQYKAAKEQMEAAKAKYDMAMNGARPEEITATEALFNQALNGYNEASAYFQELTIKSPLEGEISNSIVDEGEVISAGYPIFTILDPNDSYIVIQLREDQLQKVKKGNVYKGRVPGLGNEEFEFEVTYMAAMADFATWKPTSQKGEFDLKMFEIHLRPKQPVNGLRPGMTANIKF